MIEKILEHPIATSFIIFVTGLSIAMILGGLSSLIDSFKNRILKQHKE